MVFNFKGQKREHGNPFIILEKTFDDQFFDKLNEEMFSNIKSRRVMGGRFNKLFDPEIFDKKEFPAWNQFYNFITSYEFKEKLQNEYESDLKYWKASTNFLDPNLKLELSWSTSRDGYWREPHYDTNGRIFGFLIFFNDKKWDGGDLTLHGFKNVFFHVRKYFLKKLPIRNIVEAKSNRGVFWLSSPNSYHSVSLQKNTKENRKFITGHIYGNQKMFHRKTSNKLNIVYLISDMINLIYLKIRVRILNSNGDINSRFFKKIINGLNFNFKK